MFKLKCLLFALTVILTSAPLCASAASTAVPTPKIYAGLYLGICTLQSLDGSSISYSPVQFTVAKTGVILGAALKDGPGFTKSSLTTFSGKVGKIKKIPSFLLTRASSRIQFSDGAELRITFDHNDVKGFPRSSQVSVVDAPMKFGDYLGRCFLGLNR